MSRRRPEALAREAMVLLGCGLSALTLFALLTYRAGGPRWPHPVVDVSAWTLVLVAATMLVIASVEKVVELVARHLAR
jgi:hypothetical protein